jgi:hypothetical protein
MILLIIILFGFKRGTGKSPSNVDGVLASYRDYLPDKSCRSGTLTLLFLKSNGFNLTTTSGWGETFNNLKRTYSSNADGTVTYNDFGRSYVLSD